MMPRKTKYNDDFPLLAEDFARRGMIDVEIAKNLGIHVDSLYNYQKKYIEFFEAIKRGKAPVDIEVENALLKRARGYDYEEAMVEYKPGKGEKGEEKAMPTVIRKTKKQVIPDTIAQIFWLTNRRPKLWKHKKDVALTGNLNMKIITAVPRSNPTSNKKKKKK